MQSPDMIKIHTDAGFKYIHERHVETVTEFLRHPFAFRFDKEQCKILIEAFTIMRDFLYAQDMKYGYIYFVSENGRDFERVMFADRDYFDMNLKYLNKLIM